MLLDNYRREMDAIGPSDVQMERLLTAIREETPARRRAPLCHVLAVAAVCAALTITALAAGPVISGMLQKALGTFVPYAQSQEGIVEKEGIQVKVVSALTDDLCVQVFLEVTDLTGDRLKDAAITGKLKLDLEGETSWSEGCRIVDYDPEAKTALVCLERNSGVFLQGEVNTTVLLSDLQPGRHVIQGQEEISLEGLTSEPVPSQVLPTRETVLIPNETERELTGGIALAAVGFGGDGRFHTLFRLPDEAILERSWCMATPRSQVVSDRGDPFWGATVGESGRCPHPQDGTYDENTAAFEQDGKKYYDVSYVRRPGGRSLPESLAPITCVYKTEEPVEATWELPVTLRPVETITSPLCGLIDHNALKELRLSPLGVVLVSNSTDWTQITGYPLTVFLSDGATFHPESGVHGHQKDGPNMARWVFDRPVEVNDIAGVALGCWMIPVENGVAGEGYWLPELPK